MQHSYKCVTHSETNSDNNINNDNNIGYNQIVIFKISFSFFLANKASKGQKPFWHQQYCKSTTQKDILNISHLTDTAISFGQHPCVICLVYSPSAYIHPTQTTLSYK